MADFFEKQEEQEEAPSTLKIGEKEYTQQEVESMVTKAQQIEQLESQYNTKLDKVWPEYGKSQNRNKELEAELEALKSQAMKPEVPSEFTEDQIQDARQQARKIGIVTEDAFGEFMSKNFKQFYTQERQAEKIIDEGTALEATIDGSDGRPKFVLQDVLEYMRDNELTVRYGLEKAYRDMHENEIDKWKMEQLKQNKPQPFITQDSSAGVRQPLPIKPTEANIEQLVREGLGDY